MKFISVCLTGLKFNLQGIAMNSSTTRSTYKHNVELQWHNVGDVDNLDNVDIVAYYSETNHV